MSEEQKKTRLFVDVEEFQKMILHFIGSDHYKQILSCVDDTKNAGFMAGLSIAAALITSECDYYVVKE